MRTHTAVLSVVLAASLTSGCLGSHEKTFKPFAASSVAISGIKHQAPMTLGVLVSGSSGPGQGKDDLRRAAGARVAQFRLHQGGIDVSLLVVDDKGTAEGALAALTSMAASNVSGVVVATEGTHLSKALTFAAEKNLPVVLPYQRDVLPEATSSVYTGLTTATMNAALRSLLTRQQLQQPFVLTTADTASAVAALATPGHVAVVTATTSPLQAIAPVLAAVKAKGIDSVVLSADAATQAAWVGQLQGHAPSLSIVLTPQALSPVFGDGLAASFADNGGATTSGRFLTVGPSTQDSDAQAQDADGQAISAFLQGVRLAAAAPDVHALTHAVAFGTEGAATADVLSHDAVIALVRAVEKAGKSTPAAVLISLRTLSLRHADGLAGPALVLSQQAALTQDKIVSLAGTTQDSGARGGIAEPLAPLQWFPLPAGA